MHTSGNRHARCILLASVAWLGCSPFARKAEEPRPPDPPPPVVDLVVDANRNGVVEPGDPTEDALETAWSATHGAIMLANLDDDDGKGDADANDAVVNGDADVADLAPVRVRAWPDAPDGATGLVTMNDGAQGNVRLFLVDGDATMAASYIELSFNNLELTTARLRAGALMAAEAFNVVTGMPDAWDGVLVLHLEVKDGSGVVLGFDDVALHVAPLIFQHNIAPTQTVYYSNIQPDARTLALGLAAAASGAAFNVAALNLDDRRLEYDQWTQDFFDVGHMSRPGPGGMPVGMKVAVRSAQPDRAAGDVTEVRLRGPDFGSLFIHATRYDPNTHGYSMSSFGNWDVVPPYTKGDLTFPLGRNIWGQGSVPSEKPDGTFALMVRAQKVQPELNVDTSFLAVGHMDEIVSFVKTNTPRGWGLLAASPTLARSMLTSLSQDGHGSALMFEGKSWLDDNFNEAPAQVTVDAALANADLMAASQAAQLRIDENVDLLTTEIGLAPEEVTPMPFLIENIFDMAVAYQPGTVNLLHVDARVLIPDPFGPVVDGKDPFKEDLRTRLGALGLDVYFADDWDLYHRLEGEVHCGTNVARDMAVKWWEFAQ